MSEHVVPPQIKLAAKRGFVRTFTQTLSNVIPTSGVIIAISNDAVVGAAIGVVTGVVNSLLAGSASYLMIVSRGVPEEYSTAAETY